jgi:excisionase family DNA binding protein
MHKLQIKDLCIISKKGDENMVYSPKGAADILGVSTATILRRISDKSLPACKLGKSVIRIDEKDLNAFKESRMTVKN